MNLQDLQKKIEASYPRPIRLEKTKKNRKESLQEFLILFFTTLNRERCTIYVDTREVQTPTKGGHVGGCRRSLGDIFMICKYYFPKVTLQEVLTELIVGLPAYFPKGFRTSYCKILHKKVWYYDENQENHAWDMPKHDEWGNSYYVYKKAINGEESELQPVVEAEEDDEEAFCEDCGEYGDECTC